jgi:sugar phosphate isomerase/epimerase
MRFGGPVFVDCSEPGKWIEALKKKGYSSAFCPVSNDKDEGTIRAFAKAAEDAGIVIAEVGAWSNPNDPNPEKQREAIEHCKKQLALADAIGARCCVNITGSRGELWAGHHPLNLTQETFDLIVHTTRSIIDAVKPSRTYYTLETMQWMYPDSVQSYIDLVHAIDRDHCAVHFDPTNLINCPQRYYSSGEIIHDFVDRLGPMIRSCHAKDIIMLQDATVHLNECLPGTGNLDYSIFLREVSKLEADVPVMMEHLQTEAEYDQAAAFIRSVAEKAGVKLG